MMFLGTHKIFKEISMQIIPPKIYIFYLYFFYLLATFNQLKILNHVLWIKFYLLYIIYAERMSRKKKIFTQ